MQADRRYRSGWRYRRVRPAYPEYSLGNPPISKGIAVTDQPGAKVNLILTVADIQGAATGKTRDLANDRASVDQRVGNHEKGEWAEEVL